MNLYKPATVSLDLVKTDSGFYTWRGNEDGFAAHTNCIIALYEGHSIGDPERWLTKHNLQTMRRESAIRQLDICRGRLSDVKVVKTLAKKLGMTVSIMERSRV